MRLKVVKAKAEMERSILKLGPTTNIKLNDLLKKYGVNLDVTSPIEVEVPKEQVVKKTVAKKTVAKKTVKVKGGSQRRIVIRNKDTLLVRVMSVKAMYPIDVSCLKIQHSFTYQKRSRR